MAQANATLADSQAAKKGAKIFEDQMNGPNRMIGDMNMVREPKFYVYIYNVGPIEHKIERPWCAVSSFGKCILIPACGPNERYSTPVVFPDVIQEKVSLQGSNEFSFRGRDAKFYVQDAINPDDPQGNWKTVRPINQGLTTNMGTNLYNWGVFWTVTKPPEEEALETAKLRLESHLNELIIEANSMHLTKKDNEIGFTHRKAAQYFGLETEWYAIRKSKQACPGCGEMIPYGIPMHRECGAIFDKKRVLALGLRTKEQLEGVQ